jgi:hypothetical protein
MLHASGAGLEEISVGRADGRGVAVVPPAECGAALAQLLHTCSATLKTIRISADDASRRVLNPAFTSEVALGLASCCEGLERLCVPWEVFEGLPPTCPAFKRLTHLNLENEARPIDTTSPVWDLVASGLLPALTDLSVHSTALSWGHEAGGGCRLTRAFEGVAGTLRRLTLHSYTRVVPPAGACHELGVAIGKLRRLTYLFLCLFKDGLDYQAVGQGLAASGGCPPLYELHVLGIEQNMDCLIYEPDLIVSSVRDLHTGGQITDQEALMLCCGLVKMGYKHRLTFPYVARNYHDCVAILEAGGIHTKG